MNQSLRKANPIQETVCGFAPATIANVNVGFDVLGISLSTVGDRVEVTPNGTQQNKITFIESATPLPYAVEKNSCTVVIAAMQAQLENPLYVDVLPLVVVWVLAVPAVQQLLSLTIPLWAILFLWRNSCPLLPKANAQPVGQLIMTMSLLLFLEVLCFCIKTNLYACRYLRGCMPYPSFLI